MVEVTRIDVYDFKVTLTQSEFKQVKNISDCENIIIENLSASPFSEIGRIIVSRN